MGRFLGCEAKSRTCGNTFDTLLLASDITTNKKKVWKSFETSDKVTWLSKEDEKTQAMKVFLVGILSFPSTMFHENGDGIAWR